MKYSIIFFVSTYLILFSNIFAETIEDIQIQNLQSQIQILKNKIQSLKEQKYQRTHKKTKDLKIGLVLSGGGAKGFAHIGVLKVLEANHIKVDYITGTSMGALIGSLYSVGYTPEQIEKMVADINWQEAFNDTPDFSDISIAQRSIMKNYNLSMKYDNSLNFMLPRGVKNTQKIYLTLKNKLASVENIKNFNKLPIPLEIIATNLDTGKATVFKSGDLAQVITASISIPTIFDPVKINNTYYVDGLVSRNFPVQDAFDMGADIVIGVNVGATLQKKKHKYNILNVADQIMTIQSASSTKEQRKLATILIEPNVLNYKTTDFNKFKEITKLGEIATEKKLNKILDYKPNVQPAEIPLTKKTIFTINQLDIVTQTNNSHHKEIIRYVFENYIGKSITPKKLEMLMLKVYSLNFVYKVYYEFDGDILKLTVEENPTNTVGLGVDYETDYGSIFTIGTNINTFGKIGSLSTIDASFGDYLGFNLKNFSYYGISNKAGILTSFGYNETPFNLYYRQNKIGSYKNINTKLQGAVITQYSNLFLLSYGTSVNYTHLRSKISTPLNPLIEYNKSYGTVFFNINWNTTNSLAFPTKGYKGMLSQKWGGNLGNENLNFLSTNYLSSNYFPITNNTTLTAKFYGGKVTGDNILPDKYIKLGGLYTNIEENVFSFNGYYFQEKYVSELFGTSFGIQNEILEDLYLGLNWDIATYNFVNEKYSNQHNFSLWNNYSQGIGISLSYLSIIGPLQFSVSKAQETHDYLFQFSFGYKFN